jgi:hypothetical protein
MDCSVQANDSSTRQSVHVFLCWSFAAAKKMHQRKASTNVMGSSCDEPLVASIGMQSLLCDAILVMLLPF